MSDVSYLKTSNAVVILLCQEGLYQVTYSPPLYLIDGPRMAESRQRHRQHHRQQLIDIAGATAVSELDTEIKAALEEGVN